MQKLITAALLTLCLISTGCAPSVRIVKPPADKLICAELPTPPKLTPLDWAAVQSVDEAKALVFKREGETADYIIALRGVWFSCSSMVKWHREYNANLP